MMRVILGFLFAALTSVALAASPVPANGVISVPGEYYLLAHRSSNGANYVIHISASNVTLDLNRKIVQCTPPKPAGQSTFGIIAHYTSNVTIRNGKTLGCRQGISVLNSTSPRIENVKLHARHIGVYSNAAVTGLIVRHSEFHDIAGAADQAYAVGVWDAGSNCTIERNVFKNLHRQAGVPSHWVGEGVAVIFSSGSTGCVAKGNRQENEQAGSHLEIGFWVGNAVVSMWKNDFTNVGRAVAASPGFDLLALDNKFWMRQPQSGSYAIGAQQGLAKENLIVGYDDPILGYIQSQDNLILP